MSEPRRVAIATLQKFSCSVKIGRGFALNVETLNESRSVVMTLASLSSTQRVAPREDFDPEKVRALIADYLGSRCQTCYR